MREAKVYNERRRRTSELLEEMRRTLVRDDILQEVKRTLTRRFLGE
jgi:hypothetical protein